MSALHYETTREAAERLGVNPSRIRQLAIAGQIEAIKAGRDWLIPKGAKPHSKASTLEK